MTDNFILKPEHCAPWDSDNWTTEERKDTIRRWSSSGVRGWDGVKCYYTTGERLSDQGTWYCECHLQKHSPFLDIPANISIVGPQIFYYFMSHSCSDRGGYDLPSTVVQNCVREDLSTFTAYWFDKDEAHRENGPWEYEFIGSKIVDERFVIRNKSLNPTDFKQRYEFLNMRPYEYKHDPKNVLAHIRSTLGYNLNLIDKAKDF